MAFEQLHLDLESELASELYIDEVVDGGGRLLGLRGLLRGLRRFVTLDSVGSVSAVDRDRGPTAEQDGCEGGLPLEPPPHFLETLWEGTDHG